MRDTPATSAHSNLMPIPGTSPHEEESSPRDEASPQAKGGPVQIHDFLAALREASRSNYAFVAYLGVLAAFAYLAVTRAKLQATTKSLAVLAAEERAEALRRLYPEFPTTGMSADEFIRSRRNAQILIAFITLVIGAVAIATIVLARAAARH
jgi:hypothetical protein